MQHQNEGCELRSIDLQAVSCISLRPTCGNGCISHRYQGPQDKMRSCHYLGILKHQKGISGAFPYARFS